MESYDIIANQPVVIDNVSSGREGGREPRPAVAAAGEEEAELELGGASSRVQAWSRAGRLGWAWPLSSAAA